MHLGSFAAALTLIPALAWAQLSPNTVTVTASSGSSAQPDQALFSISVGAGIDKGLDDIVKALAGSGITAANLTRNQQSGLHHPCHHWSSCVEHVDVSIGRAAGQHIQTETASLISLLSLAQNSPRAKQ